MLFFLPCSLDEERLRPIYEEKFKGINKEAANIINICSKTVETLMRRIHKLRDNELQPQLAALINGYQIASLIHYADIYLSFGKDCIVSTILCLI